MRYEILSPDRTYVTYTVQADSLKEARETAKLIGVKPGQVRKAVDTPK